MKYNVKISQGYYDTIVKALNAPNDTEATNVLLGNLVMLQDLCSFTTITKANNELEDYVRMGVVKEKGCFWINGTAGRDDYFVEAFKLVKEDDGWEVERFAITTQHNNTLHALTKALVSGFKEVPSEWVDLKEEKPSGSNVKQGVVKRNVAKPHNIPPQAHRMASKGIIGRR